MHSLPAAKPQHNHMPLMMIFSSSVPELNVIQCHNIITRHSFFRNIYHNILARNNFVIIVPTMYWRILIRMPCIAYAIYIYNYRFL